MSQFISRAYNTFELDKKTKSIVIKRSKEVRLAQELKYYLTLPTNLAIYFPRISYHNTTAGVTEVGMEYYAYDNLGNLMINEEFDETTWNNIFSFIFTFFENTQQYVSNLNGKDDCRLMYINKTEAEYKNLLEQFPFFNVFETNPTITLNGEEMKTFSVMWPKLKEYIESNCLVDTLSYVHGDMCFSNILYGVNPINKDVVLKFIDPRGVFGKTENYGDFYYDLAKLMHSCDGKYEYFITDNFTVTNSDTDFTLSFSGQNANNIKKTLDKLIETRIFNNTKIQLLQGLIYIGMCARHYDSFERQKGMFLTGTRILNNVYNNLFGNENNENLF